MDFESIKVVGEYTAVVTLIWYLWYDTSRARPKSQEVYVKSMTTLQADCHRVQAEMVSAFREDTKGQRAEFLAEAREMRVQFTREMDSLRQVRLKEIDRLLASNNPKK
jgi:hypothetical protein